MENKKPIRKQLCKKCLAKYRVYENERRQRLRIKEKVAQVSGKIKIKIKK
jgi:hypothetical protein